MFQQHIGEIAMVMTRCCAASTLAAGTGGYAGYLIQRRDEVTNADIDDTRYAHSCSVWQPPAPVQAIWSTARFTHPRGGGRNRKPTEDCDVNQRQLKLFQRLLGARRRELLEEAERTVGGMTDSKENFPDPTDRASLESNRNAMLRIRDRERKLISKIDDALQRIQDGSYGLCESCGGPIGIDRLKARPVTTLCIDCKSDQEAQERRQRG